MIEQSHPRLRPLASRRRRVASLAYEAFLIVAIFFVASLIVVPILRIFPAAPRRLALQVCLLFVAGTYCVMCWVRGHTLPMKTWGITVARRDGDRLRTSDAVKRFLWAIPGTMFFFAGFLWCVVDPDRQFLHDRLAGTRLFDAPSSTALKPSDQGDAGGQEQ